MSTYDNAPAPDGWQPEPKPWNELLCCPADCGICMTASESVWMHGVEAHILRGEN